MKNQFKIAFTLALVLSLIAATVVLADTLLTDGDGLAPIVDTPSLALGNVCAGATVTKPILHAIDSSGHPGKGNNVFADGSGVVVSVTSVSGNGLSATGGGKITLPSNWVETKTITSDSVSSSITFAAGKTTGSFSGTVNYKAEGPGSNGGTLTRTDTLAVTANVVNCDTTPPTLNLPASLTVEATGSTGAAVTFTATADDANPAHPAVTCSPASGSTFPLGASTVSCSATDAAGNTATGSFTVTVQDTTPPAVTPPSNIVFEATGGSGAVVSYSGQSAFDLVDGPLTPSCSPASGSTFGLGLNTVTCSATDSHNNTGSRSFTINVTDTTAPALSLPADLTVEAAGPAGAMATFSASASDLVDGPVAVSCDHNSGATFPLGVTTVTCSATDKNNNTSTGSFKVNVLDTTAPTLTIPASSSLEATGPTGTVAAFTATANDIVDGALAVTCSPASGSVFPLGATEVTCSAKDTHDNTATGTFTLTVVDKTAPKLTLPADQQLEATGPSGAVATFTASAADLVDGSVTPVCNAASGATFPLGTTKVTCTATDAAGNQASGSFVIIVKDTTPPTLVWNGGITDNATYSYGSVPAEPTCTAVDGGSGPDTCVVTGYGSSAGSYTLTATARDQAGNKTVETRTYSVTPIDPTCVVTGFTGVYDAAAHGASGICTGIGGESAGTLSLGGTFTNVPGGTVHWTFTGNGNYNAKSGDVNIAITQRPVTANANALTKVFGDADPTLNYQVTGGSLANGDAFTGSLTRISGENVGAYAIQQGTLALNANYALTFAGADLTITPRPVSVTAGPQTKVYGDTDPALIYQITSGNLVNADTFSGSLNRDAGENVGSYPITRGSLALSGNYALTFKGADLTITPRPVTVTAGALTKVYGDADPALIYQITGGSLAFNDVFTGSLTRDAGENVGSYPITQGTLALGSNYDLAFVDAKLAITPRPLTVTAGAQTKVYGDSDPVLTYKITNGSLAFSDAFTGSLTRAAGENVGSYAITQDTLALSSNYNLTFNGARLTITPRPASVIADNQSKIYGQDNPALTAQVSGTVNGDKLDFTLSTTAVKFSGVGSYPIAVTLGSNPNYAVTPADGALKITPKAASVTAEDKTRIYGDNNPDLTAQVSGTLNGDTLDFSLATTATKTSNVGPYPITITLGLNPNYDISTTSGSLLITQRPLTVTAGPQTKVYGDPDPALTYQITSGNLVNADTFGGSLTRTAGENVGSYAITQGSLVLSSNYALSFVGANLAVTPRPVSVTADALTKVYGDADPALTYQITDGSLVNGDKFSGSLTRDAGEKVGTYAITQGTLALSTNYTLIFVGAKLAITPALLTVTADNQTKLLNAPNPIFTFKVYGLKNGETASVLTTQPTCASPATTTSPVGSYPITCSGGSATNYTFAYVPATLTIQYRFDGFLQPINDTAHTQLCGSPCPVSIFKGGSTIPVKFQLKDANGVVVQTTGALQWLAPLKGGPTTAAVDESSFTDSATLGTVYYWDGQQYHYNWSTKGLATGFYYRIGVKLDDGQIFYVYIGLR